MEQSSHLYSLLGPDRYLSVFSMLFHCFRRENPPLWPTSSSAWCMQDASPWGSLPFHILDIIKLHFNGVQELDPIYSYCFPGKLGEQLVHKARLVNRHWCQWGNHATRGIAPRLHLAEFVAVAKDKFVEAHWLRLRLASTQESPHNQQVGVACSSVQRLPYVFDLRMDMYELHNNLDLVWYGDIALCGKAPDTWTLFKLFWHYLNIMFYLSKVQCMQYLPSMVYPPQLVALLLFSIYVVCIYHGCQLATYYIALVQNAPSHAHNHKTLSCSSSFQSLACIFEIFTHLVHRKNSCERGRSLPIWRGGAHLKALFAERTNCLTGMTNRLWESLSRSGP